jgi:SAM-dependent methyltransferase
MVVTRDWYAAMADVYDDVVQWSDDVSFFVEETSGVTGPVVELMAGTGRLSIPLIEAGIELTCVDVSPEMLDRLRAALEARGLTAKLVEADVRRLPLDAGAYQLVVLGFQSFSELVGEDDRRKALAEVWRILMPGGRFICTLYNPTVRARAFPRPSEPRIVREDERGAVSLLAETDLDRTSGIASGFQTIIFRSPAGVIVEERRFPVRFALITREWFDAAAVAADFAIESFFGDYTRAPYDAETSPFMIWTMRSQ